MNTRNRRGLESDPNEQAEKAGPTRDRDTTGERSSGKAARGCAGPRLGGTGRYAPRTEERIVLADGGTETRRPVQERISEIANDVREHGNYGEVSVFGQVGFHTFYNEDHCSLPMGATTAMHIAFERTIEEVFLDADTIEYNQGEVTPESIADEAEAQMEEFIGRHRFFDRFTNNLQEVLENAGGSR